MEAWSLNHWTTGTFLTSPSLPAVSSLGYFNALKREREKKKKKGKLLYPLLELTAESTNITETC